MSFTEESRNVTATYETETTVETKAVGYNKLIEDDNLNNTQLTELSDIDNNNEINNNNNNKNNNQNIENNLTVKTKLLSKNSDEGPWTDEHRDLGDGGYRAAIFGFSDGLITNLCLIIGVQFALDEGNDAPLLVTGMSGLIAGAFSMAIGEWISMKAQAEALQAEISLEHKHLSQYWPQEMAHLREILSNSGLKRKTIESVIEDLGKAPKEKVVDLHARLELGIDPEETGNAEKAMIFSFVMFSLGAFIPMLPYTFLNYHTAWKVTVAVCGVIVILLGYGLGIVSQINPWKAAARQTILVAIAVAGVLALSFATTHLK